MSKNNGYITVLNVDGHKHTRRAGFHNPCGFVTDTYVNGGLCYVVENIIGIHISAYYCLSTPEIHINNIHY